MPPLLSRRTEDPSLLSQQATEGAKGNMGVIDRSDKFARVYTCVYCLCFRTARRIVRLSRLLRASGLPGRGRSSVVARIVPLGGTLHRRPGAAVEVGYGGDDTVL